MQRHVTMAQGVHYVTEKCQQHGPSERRISNPATDTPSKYTSKNNIRRAVYRTSTHRYVPHANIVSFTPVSYMPLESKSEREL